MIVPMIHRVLRRDDVARLIAAIARIDASAAARCAIALRTGAVDDVLDAPEALDAVRGNGGAPAPLPLPLLWYVPVRACLRTRGETDIGIADFAATLPVVFTSSRLLAQLQRGDAGLVPWTRSVTALPRATVARAERAAQVAGLALWWAGCFPERIEHLGGRGLLRAYVDFAQWALDEASRGLGGHQSDTARTYAAVASRAALVRTALAEAREDYLVREAHAPSRRLSRFLHRLADR